MKDYKTVEIKITGIVQGVGFRPFLYNLAHTLNLKGYILNRGNAGVRLILQGDSQNIKKFLADIKIKKPKISFIEDIETNFIEIREEFKELELLKKTLAMGEIIINDKHFKCNVCGKPHYIRIQHVYDGDYPDMQNTKIIITEIDEETK